MQHSSRVSGRSCSIALASAIAAASFSTCWADAPPHLASVQAQQRKIAERAMAATVGIQAHPRDGRGPGGPGSGAVVSAQGLILTAAHVVAGATKIDVMFSDGTKAVATVLGVDGEQDLALAKIDSCNPFPFVEMAAGGPVASGSPVLATGNFGGLLQGRQPPFRAGTVKGVANPPGDGVMIVTNCLVGPGDSGGPLFDEQGEVIGVHHALTSMDLAGDSMHSPVSFVHQNWQRLMRGERWGNYQRWVVDGKSLPTVEELAGVNLANFTQRLFREFPKGGVNPQNVRTWLREYGMREEVVAKLSDPQAMAWVSRALAPFGFGSSNFANPAANNPGANPPVAPTAQGVLPKDAARVPAAKDGLAGLNVEKFKEWMIGEAKKEAKEEGAFYTPTGPLREQMVLSGMDKSAVDNLSEFDVVDLVLQIMQGKGSAQITLGAGAASGGNDAPQPKTPTTTPVTQVAPALGVKDGLAGLNVDGFRQWMMDAAKKGNGRLDLSTELLREQLILNGMDKGVADKMSVYDLVGLAQRLISGGGAAPAGTNDARPEAPATQPVGEVAPTSATKNDGAGLNESKLREWVMEEAKKSNGMLAVPPETLREQLIRSGMDKGVADKMSAGDMSQLMQRLVSGVGQAYIGNAIIPQQVGAPTQAATDAAGLLRGIDSAKFRDWVLSEVQKSKGALSVETPTLRAKLVECGMDEDAASKLSDEVLYQMVPQALMNTPASTATPRQSSINIPLLDADRKALEPMLAKLSSSVVRLTCDDKVLVLGTVVRADGLILTKLSEIGEAGDRLRVQLGDGRTLPAKVVQSFSGDDLALVKVEAEKLPALVFPNDPSVLAPGTFVFTPGGDPAAPLLSAGVVSVREDQLHSAGNLIGIRVEKAEAGVVVREVVDSMPVHKVLESGDVVIAVNGQAAGSQNDIIRAVQSVTPGSKVRVEYRRDGVLHRDDVEVVAGEDSPWVFLDKSAASKRPSGYPVCFENDQPLKPDQCGGPLMSADGEVVGLNIARSNRSGSRAIPSRVIAEILKNAKP